MKKILGRPRILNEIISKKTYAEVILTNGEITLIDLEDVGKIKDYTWCKSDHGYAETHVKIESGRRKRMFLHRLIMNVHANYNNIKTPVDHISRNKLDNRKGNLRITNNTQNQYNRGLRKDNTAGATGVVFDKRGNGYWTARLNHKGKSYTKTFKTKDEAIKYRKELEKKFFK